MNNYHIPVLLQEVLQYLKIKPEGLYIDATLGGGGHAFAIIKHGGRVLGIDTDQDAIEHVEQELGSKNKELSKNLKVVNGNFAQIKQLAKENGFDQVDGILLDLGVSSHQFDTPDRGFSFQPGPLDMRMGKSLSVTAADLVNGLTEKELSELFVRLGEEPYARRIARLIVDARKIAPFTTTDQLAGLIKRSIHSGDAIHPATRVFQALRIAVNDELHALRESLPQAVSLLKPGGRLVIISFHSLEDRIVKQTFEKFRQEGLGENVTKKPVIATDAEVLQNRRARSAKLRVFEKF